MTAYYNEIDQKAGAGLRALIADGLIPPGEVDTRSITDVRPDDLKGFTQCHFFAGIGGWSRALDLASWPHDRPVWTGSCPCQPFSAAGKQKGGADDRDLWPVWFRLISERRPAIVFGEQVASAIPHGWLDRVYSDMEAEGYACGSAVLPACAVNAPHRRDRLWFVANADKDGRAALSISGIHDKEHHVEPCGIVGDTQGLRSGRRQDDENQGRRECASSDTGAGVMADSESLRGRTRLCETRSVENRHGASGACDRNCQDYPPPRSLADSSIKGPQRRLRGRQDKEREDQHGYAGRSSASGFWDDHEWILCADGKARRIPSAISPLRVLVDGIPEFLGALRSFGHDKSAKKEVEKYGQMAKTGPEETLQAVQQIYVEEKIRGETRGLHSVCQPEILFSFLREITWSDLNSGNVCSIAEATQDVLRSLHIYRTATGTPCGWESVQQQTTKPSNALHLLSYVLAQYAKQAWSWHIDKDAIPLLERYPERVGLLRAGGNAIVPQEGARFIEAAREAIES